MGQGDFDAAENVFGSQESGIFYREEAGISHGDFCSSSLMPTEFL